MSFCAGNIYTRLEPHTFEEGSVVFKARDCGEEMYFLTSGEVQLDLMPFRAADGLSHSQRSLQFFFTVGKEVCKYSKSLYLVLVLVLLCADQQGHGKPTMILFRIETTAQMRVTFTLATPFYFTILWICDPPLQHNTSKATSQFDRQC